jgi:Cu/Ag efflux protein CusF
LQGEVLSIDIPSKAIYVKHGNIPGYWKAMRLVYVVRDTLEIAALHSDYKIRADVVLVNGLAP